MSNHDHLSNIGLHPAYDPDPAVHVPVRVNALRRRISEAQSAIDAMVGLEGSTVTVTIGRNVDDQPLWSFEWQEFRAIVGATLDNLLAPDFSASYDGRGQWNGVSEDSTTFVASGVTTHTPRQTLVDAMAHLAKRYGQDAIAVTIGLTTLVDAS